MCLLIHVCMSVEMGLFRPHMLGVFLVLKFLAQMPLKFGNALNGHTVYEASIFCNLSY